MRSSAVSVHLPQGLIVNAFLLTTNVKHGYVSYGSLPVSLNHSGHSPLTSLFEVFPSAELPLTFSIWIQLNPNSRLGTSVMVLRIGKAINEWPNVKTIIDP